VRRRPGAGGADDRELPHRDDLGPDAPMWTRRRGTAPRRIHRRLARRLQRRERSTRAERPRSKQVSRDLGGLHWLNAGRYRVSVVRKECNSAGWRSDGPPPQAPNARWSCSLRPVDFYGVKDHVPFLKSIPWSPFGVPAMRKLNSPGFFIEMVANIL